MLLHHKTYVPAFALPAHRDQMPLAFVTVLSINDKVGDCAAYRGITPANPDTDILELVRAGGSKIFESEARELFPIIEERNLRYRY